MSATTALPSDRPSTPRSKVKPERYFYAAAGLLMLALAFWGFNRFYLHLMAYPGREIAPPMKLVVISHGSAMTAWLLLMVIQPVLILRRSHKLHMAVGRAGAVLAGLILVTGVLVSVMSGLGTPAEVRIWGLPPRQFMIVPFVTAWIFAALVALGVYYRRKPALHRSMMLLATLSALSAAVSRIDTFNNLYVGTVWERAFGPFFTTLILYLVLLAVRCAMTRSFDRVLAAGIAILFVTSYGMWQLAPTSAWASFVSLFAR